MKKTQLKRSSCKRLKPNEFLNGDVGFTLVNLNFGKQILVSPCGLPHYSFLYLLLCASASIYLVVLFLCVHGLEIYLISPAETLHQVTFVLEIKEGRNSDFGQVLHRTGLTGFLLLSTTKSWTDQTGMPDRSDRSVC